jgi:hypothetical protein
MSHPRDVYPKLWAEARGREARFLELLIDRGHIAERLDACPVCGVASRHRHEADGALVEVDRKGRDRR